MKDTTKEKIYTLTKFSNAVIGYIDEGYEKYNRFGQSGIGAIGHLSIGTVMLPISFALDLVVAPIRLCTMSNQVKNKETKRK